MALCEIVYMCTFGACTRMAPNDKKKGEVFNHAAKWGAREEAAAFQNTLDTRRCVSCVLQTFPSSFPFSGARRQSIKFCIRKVAKISNLNLIQPGPVFYLFRPHIGHGNVK